MKGKETEKHNELSVTPRGTLITGESQACQVTCSSVKKRKTRPQQVGEGNAPNELISGSNAQSAEAIHQCHSKATSGKCYKITDSGRTISGSLNFKEENRTLYRSNRQRSLIATPGKV